MTYVTLDVWEKCCKGLSKDDYQELYARGILPTKLLPRSPSKYYAKPSGDHPVGNDTRKLLKQTFEKKYGRKYNWRDEKDRVLYYEMPERIKTLKVNEKTFYKNNRTRIIASTRKFSSSPKQRAKRQTPKYRKHRQLLASTPERKAKMREIGQRPENMAKQRERGRIARLDPKVRAKKNAYYQKNRKRFLEYEKKRMQIPEVKARRSAYHKAYVRTMCQTPEYKARRKAKYNKPENLAHRKAYNRRPDVIARSQTPEFKAKVREYNQRPEVRARSKAYAQRPDVKARNNLLRRQRQKQ